MAISADDVRHIAALARLALDQREVEEMSVQLSAILEHMEALRQVDVEGVAPVANATDRGASPREDGGAPDALHLAPAEIAPAWVDPFFVVPRLAALDTDAPAPDAIERESR